MTTDLSKRRAGTWDCTLSDEQRWQIYERSRQFSPTVVLPWIAQEFGIEAPSRAGYYRWCAAMRAQESAHRIEQAITEKAHIRQELDAIGDITPDLKDAFAQEALAARIRGDAGGATQWLKLALAIGKGQLAAAEHDLKVKAEQRAVAALALEKERFEVVVCEKFLAWFQDARAREIAESPASNTEKIAALRKAFLADVDALDKSGEVQLPA